MWGGLLEQGHCGLGAAEPDFQALPLNSGCCGAPLCSLGVQGGLASPSSPLEGLRGHKPIPILLLCLTFPTSEGIRNASRGSSPAFRLPGTVLAPRPWYWGMLQPLALALLHSLAGSLCCLLVFQSRGDFSSAETFSPPRGR